MYTLPTNNPQADSTTTITTPYLLHRDISSSAFIPFITQQELKEMKRAALAELDLSYIPQVMAGFKGGEQLDS